MQKKFGPSWTSTRRNGRYKLDPFGGLLAFFMAFFFLLLCRHMYG